MKAVVLALALAGVLLTRPLAAFEPKVLDSVVSVLPLWPGYGRGAQPGQPPGLEPEGTAVAIRSGGYLITALHVIDQSEDILVRLRDGRLLPATEVGRDPLTDLALLQVEDDLPSLAYGPEPTLGDEVCAVGNQFGLGLSVTCGVVSATRRSGIGFNGIEDFVQTDAVVNPGASGGALVDREGRLVGVLSAIFTKESDANIGVNFAASSALVQRVADALIADGRVARSHPGFTMSELSEAERREVIGVRVRKVLPDSAAAAAGLREGDILLQIDGRKIASVAAGRAALDLLPRGKSVSLVIRADGKTQGLDYDVP